MGKTSDDEIDWEDRIQRIRDRVDGPGAVVLTSLPDIRWATGFSGSNALVVLSDQAH
ncbi:MAG: hypothetical protein ACI9W4_002119, partial [Rhodothermales bacterium]